MNEDKSTEKLTDLSIDDPRILIQAADAILAKAAVPNLSGRDKLKVQHARLLLHAAVRQQEFSPSLEALDKQALKQFNCKDQVDLSAKIKAGEIVLSKELREYLKQRTLLKLAIDNPNYWGYLEAKKRWATKI